MERYHTIVKIERLRKELKRGEFDRAFDIVMQINIDKLKSMSDLSLVAEAFVHAGRYKKAKKLYLHIYEKTNSKRILSKLVHVNLKLQDIIAVEEYLNLYDKAAPEDFYRYIFRYNLYKLQGKKIKELIPVLIELKDKEYIDYWVYELAKQYHKAGDKDNCIKELDDIIMWFGEGEYVEKARALKAYYSHGMNKTHAGEDAHVLAEKLSFAMKAAPYKKYNMDNVLANGEMAESETLENEGIDRNEGIEGIDGIERTEIEEWEERETWGNREEWEVWKNRDEREDREDREEWKERIDSGEIENINVNTEDRKELSEDDLISAISKNIEIAVDEISKKVTISPSFERKKINKDKINVDAFKEGSKKRYEEVSDTVTDVKYKTAQDRVTKIGYESTKDSEFDLEDESSKNGVIDFEYEADKNNVIESVYSEAVEDVIMGITDDDIFVYPVFNEPIYEYHGRLADIIKDNDILLEEIFESYFHMSSTKKQIISSLNEIMSKQSEAAGIVITDEMNYGYARKQLAKRTAKALCRMKAVQSNKAAVINADKINNIYLPKKIDQLMNCCVIIEDSAKLSQESLLGVKELYKECNGNIMFILEGTKSALNRKLKKDIKINSMFSNRIVIPEYKMEDWKHYIYKQFKNQDYELSMKAEAMLESKINTILESGGDCFENITAYTEKCIKNSEKRSGRLLLKLSTELKFGSAQLMVISSEDLE